MTPQFTHDCKTCRLVGQLKGYDLYVHEGPNGVTLLARYGDEGPEYLSTDIGYAHSGPLKITQLIYTEEKLDAINKA